MGNRAMETVGGMQVSENEIALKIREMAKEIARMIYSGKSVEIYKVNNNTIKFYEVKKKVI